MYFHVQCIFFQAQVKVTERDPYRFRCDPSSLTDAFNAAEEQNLPVQSAATGYVVPTSEQEAILSSHINTIAELGYGYSRMETINPATEYCYHLGLRQKDSPLSLQWLYSFLERWPELRIRKPKKSGGGLNQMCNMTCH